MGALSEENWLRVQGQNEKPISVIIGNPPYNDSATLWGDDTDNRIYTEIDQRISETYIATGTAQKTHQYDMYKRFIRWASDRLADDGIIAFITNRKYIDGLQDDGFRKTMADEFSDLYVVDLGGDFQNGRGSGNIFGIRTGVAISFFVRDSNSTGTRKIQYCAIDDKQSGAEKLANLQMLNVGALKFQEITPDARHSWLNQSNGDFDNLLSLASRQTGLVGDATGESAIFHLASPGAKTNRDAWVYDFDPPNLRARVLFFADTYNEFLDSGDSSYSPVIKWSHTLEDKFNRGKRITYNDANCIMSFYRPFVGKYHFADLTMNDRVTGNHFEMFGAHLEEDNIVICFKGPSANHFSVLAANRLVNEKFAGTNNGGTFCLPLYRYTADGERVSNITEWGLRQFREHYGDDSITAEDIFSYIYAMLHDPAYRQKYEVELLREFPRAHFQTEFAEFVRLGRELLDLHLGFETVEPYPLERRDKDGARPGRAILRADKERGIITLDEQTTLAGVPWPAWVYKLGSRSALEWVLDQYKERKPRDPTIAENSTPTASPTTRNG